MYIPRPPPFPRRSDADSAVDVSTLPHGSKAVKPVTGTHGIHQTPDDGVSHNPDPLGAGNHTPALNQLQIQRRDTPNNNQNITIGATVGVLLAVFLAGFFYFVYRYHRSIRIRRRNSGTGPGARNSIASFTFGNGYGSSLKGSQSRSSRGSRGSSARYWHGRGPAAAGGR